jgi:hypothetical protein
MEPSLAPREVRAEPITGTQEVRTETSPDTIGTQEVRDVIGAALTGIAGGNFDF